MSYSDGTRKKRRARRARAHRAQPQHRGQFHGYPQTVGAYDVPASVLASRPFQSPVCVATATAVVILAILALAAIFFRGAGAAAPPAVAAPAQPPPAAAPAPAPAGETRFAAELFGQHAVVGGGHLYTFTAHANVSLAGTADFVHPTRTALGLLVGHHLTGYDFCCTIAATRADGTPCHEAEACENGDVVQVAVRDARVYASAYVGAVCAGGRARLVCRVLWDTHPRQ